MDIPQTIFCVLRKELATLQQMASKPTVIGGKLKLKGSKGTVCPLKSSELGKRSLETTETPQRAAAAAAAVVDSAAEDSAVAAPTIIDDGPVLTEAQKRFRLKQIEREKDDTLKSTKKTYRERMNEYNEKLSKLTEHNDIPRVSAAGNG